MANLFIAPVMTKLINAGFEYLKDQVGWQTGMKKNLQRLREIQPNIQAVVFAYNQAHIRYENQALNKWLSHLRDAIDEADDVLDEFEYMKHKEKGSSIAKSAKKKILNFGKHALKIDPSLNKLVEALQKLDTISADVANFLPLLEGTKQEQQEQQLELYKTRETGSLPKNDLIGRSTEMEFVRRWLRNPSDEHQTTLHRNISLLSIVGHGGMGKTTLLQHLYEDEMTKEFDLRMWVCVSSNFDVKKVISDMLESLKKERHCLESLDALQMSLKSEVMSKKFLLVLDDVWEVEEEKDKGKWEIVLASLAYGSLGSKILLTTRMDSVALMISKVIKKKKETLRLEGLEDDECLELLNIHAFTYAENSNGHTKLRIIAKEIVKKLSGSPLAAKVIGGVLNFSYDERHWLNVLNNDIQSTELGHNDIFPILRLSYIYLPKTLQSCFAFCCIFPQDYEFDRDDLVKMWIALGFIQPHYNSEETPEDIGGRSPVWMNNVNLISHVEFIQLKNCFEWQTLPPFGQLPFLKFLYLENMPKVKRIDTNKFCAFPSLELLHIKNLEALEEWFDAAEDGSFLSCLTELTLINCPNLHELPSLPPKLEKLSMEYIGWKAFRWPQSTSNCCDMSRLARLRSLSMKLCGDLIKLEGTEEVKSSENCQLVLRMLVISNPSVLLMEPFRSNISIELLVLQKNDELVSFSLEVEQLFLQASSFLRYLCFSELESLQSLPTSLTSLSSLENLHVENAPKLQFLPNIPTSLKRLHLLYLKSLPFLPSSLSFSSLKYLYLAEIPLLKSLPDLPHTLSELHLINLDNLDCPPSFIPIFSSVKELQIDGVPHLKKLVNLPPNKEKIRCFGGDSD